MTTPLRKPSSSAGRQEGPPVPAAASLLLPPSTLLSATTLWLSFSPSNPAALRAPVGLFTGSSPAAPIAAALVSPVALAPAPAPVPSRLAAASATACCSAVKGPLSAKPHTSPAQHLQHVAAAACKTRPAAVMTGASDPAHTADAASTALPSRRYSSANFAEESAVTNAELQTACGTPGPVGPCAVAAGA